MGTISMLAPIEGKLVLLKIFGPMLTLLSEELKRPLPTSDIYPARILFAWHWRG